MLVSIARYYSVNKQAKEVQQVRTLFKFGYETRLLDRPILFGALFRKPSKKEQRIAKNKQPKKLFTPEDIHKLLEVANPTMRAMVMLGINGGYGNHDCGRLPLTALDLQAGWAIFPRPKTGAQRRTPLWAETIEAINDSLACRPTPKTEGAESLVFVTKYGGAWSNR